MSEPAYSPVPTNGIVWLTNEENETAGIHRPSSSSQQRKCMAYAAVCLLAACLMHIYDRSTLNKRLSSTQRKSIMSDPDPSAPWPRIAWLMSFPNSVSIHECHSFLTIHQKDLTFIFYLLHNTGHNVHDSLDWQCHKRNHCHKLWVGEHSSNRHSCSQLFTKRTFPSTAFSSYT